MTNQNLQTILEDYFRWFHRHPERGFKENLTTARIKEILTQLGIEIADTGLKTGLVGIIRGKHKGRVVALRADIDALPIKEESGLDYASEHDGCMHACGHDFHLTSLLGAAHLLKEHQDELNGTIKLLFQPSEEMPGGAAAVLASGVLDDVEEIYGLHVASDLASGIIALNPGPTNAAVGVLAIHIMGKGGHAAHPNQGSDPIVAQAQLINALQPLVSRNTDPFAQAVVSITHITAGHTWNVIPSEVHLEGTIRTFDQGVLDMLSKRLKEVCHGVGESCGVSIELDLRTDCPATYNDPKLTEFAGETARGLGLTVVQNMPSMGGEDFSLYQKQIPGVFYFIGVGSKEPLHHPGFIADTAPLASAAELMAALGKGALTRIGQ
ncbi:hydrolase [Spirochaetia bacterium]|nr:hydrolase [Spirochaetia bacterium]